MVEMGRLGQLSLCGVGEDLGSMALARVQLACGRIAAAADSLQEAYRFGVSEGPHPEPWSVAYHREAVLVYADSLPWSYQRDIARLFHDSADIMANQSIGAHLAEDWAIVSRYLRAAFTAIEDWMASDASASRRSEPPVTPGLGSAAPRLIHFDALAQLTTSDGARRLGRATLAVQRHFEADLPPSLESSERLVLRRLAAGLPIADVAHEMGYSERSLYRQLSSLWEKLGVSGRVAGLHKATAEGLLD